MKLKIIYSLPLLVFLAACGSDETRKTEQAAFETVQEGSAPGVTSTIQGPGETVPPITGTNVDTTTAFTLSPNAVPVTQPAGGTIAGTFPDPTGMTTPMTGTYRPPVTRSTPVRNTPAPRQSEPVSRETQPAETTDPATTTATSTQPPVQTTTAPPAQQPKKNADEDEDEDEDESEQTDTAPPPPPPPGR